MSKFFEKISQGLGSTREKFQEQVNVLLSKGPNLDDDFWEGLEEALISADIGAPATIEIIDSLKVEAKRKALPDAKVVLELLSKRISEQFASDKKGILQGDKAVILFVGINGTGKTTTVGKIAKEATDIGLSVILGSADTFRAAAIEQLEVWANRANVEMVTRERGSDPASVCYATLERAEELNSDLVLIDTAGRLHTSKDLMAELKKVCNVTRKRSNVPVYVILVIDATTGQNGLTQAKEFNEFLELDGLIVTKLDGTAKGGIALAISKELDLPILKIGVGETIEDLRNFNPDDFAKAFLGDLALEDDAENIEQNIDKPIKKEPVQEELLIEKPTQEEPVHEDFKQEKPTQEEAAHTEEPVQAEEPAYEDSVNEEAIQEEHETNEYVQEELVQINTALDIEEDKDVELASDDITTEEQMFVNQEIEKTSSESEEGATKKKGKIKGLFRKLFVD